jgi:general secretion pathway protein B
MIGSGALNIPLLNLDLHVYSAQPAGRFVVINARKYREGEQLTEGPTIERITSNGVVLSSQGQRFNLPRK